MVCTWVADVQAGAGGVGEHVQDVRFGLAGVQLGQLRRAECFVLQPVCLRQGPAITHPPCCLDQPKLLLALPCSVNLL